MHELSIAQALLEVCERELAGRGGGVLESVRVAIGELSSVEPDLLRFAWEALLQDTRHDGAGIEIRFVLARQVCGACGDVPERQPGSWLRICPRCALPLRVEGGDELDLLSMTLSQDPVLRR